MTTTKNKPSDIPQWEYEHNNKIKIPVNHQVGMSWTGDKGEKFYTKLGGGNLHNGKRVARFSISSYVGTMAIGAMHWYGKIDVHRPSCLIEGESGNHGGYMGKNAPRVYEILLQVTRRITKVEKDQNDELIGKIGERTYRFNAEKDVLPEALKLFRKKFEPGWVLMDGYEDKVLCET